MRTLKLLPWALGLALVGCAGTPLPVTSPAGSAPAASTSTLATTTRPASPVPETPSVTASTSPMTPASTTPAPSTVSPPASTGSASPTTAMTWDSYPTQYKYAEVNAIIERGGRLAAVLDPVTMCTRASTDAPCKAAIGDAEYVVLNQSTKTYTVPFAAGATVKLLRSSMPDDYRTEAPKVRTWGPGSRVVFLVNSNGVTISNVTEWWHP